MNRIARMIGMTFRESRAYFPLKNLYQRCVYLLPAWLIGVVRFGVRKQGVLVFTPDFPGTASRYRIVCLLNRYDIRPASHTGAALLTVHFQQATFDHGPPSRAAVNGKWTDQSKSHLDTLHHRVFGYSLGVDPRSYSGPGVVKSELQYQNDGRITSFPVGRVEPGNVYQRFIDTVTDDGRCQDISVQVLGACMPHIRLEYRPADERRFRKNQIQDAQVVEPGDVLTEVEQRQIFELARELGMDVGKFDVLRDRQDGRIHVVDANNEPSLPFPCSNFPVIDYWRVAIEVANVFRREVVDVYGTKAESVTHAGTGTSRADQSNPPSTAEANRAEATPP